ncbi:flagellar protein FliT [Oxalobacter vibrioformis]|uniref:Flagellar protein FliT n=1 Tax=Oxalobacter vibrioformis TaxID=933080 RepID=A0A9E9P252_9BURK|nr:flagellar protein FliT [Oxalobacter vibrioformis]WAW09552.1 flagellar protein FliT [Oxalobacter vibrioformis]
MDKHVIMAVYDKISAVMSLMVQAAEMNDWDTLVDLELQCSTYVNTLRAGDHHDGLTEDEIQLKMDMIQRILEDDRRIRELADPRMKELSDLIYHSATTRKVQQAYVS